MTKNTIISSLQVPVQPDDGDGLPPLLLPLCELQKSVAIAYATTLSLVAQLQATADEGQAGGFQILLDRLRYDALWATSEVSRKSEFKIHRQRYISQDVYDRWQKLWRDAKPLGSFTKDDSILGQTLIHEHVFERKGLSLQIKRLHDSAELGKLLQTVVACVVTKDEHKRLSSQKSGEPGRAFDGWDRYRRV